LSIDRNDVQVWRVGLRTARCEIEQLRQILSNDELQRAGRFYGQQHRERFILARGTLRRILGRYMNIHPEKLGFSYINSKPEIMPELDGKRLRFNISHAGDYMLAAITADRMIGVDIELISVDRPHLRIAERFFSHRETTTLRALPEPQQIGAFYACWTRKEAYIKARGLGVFRGLDCFSVSLAPGEAAALTETESDPEEIKRWTILDINPASGYRAAAAVEGGDVKFRFYDWKP